MHRRRRGGAGSAAGSNYAFLSCYELQVGYLSLEPQGRSPLEQRFTRATASYSTWTFSKSVHHPVMSTDESSAALTAAKLEEVEVLKAVRDVETKVDNKLSEIKREIESAEDRLVKICLGNKPTFKKRVHEKQYLLNEQVWTKSTRLLLHCSRLHLLSRRPVSCSRKVRSY